MMLRVWVWWWILVLVLWAWDRRILARHAAATWVLVALAVLLYFAFRLRERQIERRSASRAPREGESPQPTRLPVGRTYPSVSRKVCTVCRRRKPAEEFYASSRSRDGLQSLCQECNRRRYLERLDPKRREALERRREQRERDRKLRENLTEEELKELQRAKNREYQRRFRERNPEYYAERYQRWKARKPAEYAAWRARQRGAEIVEMFDPNEIFERDAWTCHICGGKVEPYEAELDHIRPIAKGGVHARDNVACAHGYCNWAKGDRNMSRCASCGEQVLPGADRCPWCGFAIEAGS